ncbi:MAG: UTP--glucose-1-phosphate uridylyltransferase [Chloroflexales bacterium]|nr:UTP--glucose-1-phosphate uridylyltransferase [Chloroflexales bacterium]
MRADQLSPIAIENFRYYYGLLRAGATGVIREDEITPVTDAPAHTDIGRYADAGRAALGRAVVLKLNGGLGTGMGLDRAKSLLGVRGDLSFLDIIARQTLALSERAGGRVALLLLNSFNTDEDTQAVLARYPALRGDVPQTVMQGKVPKLLQATLAPATWPADPELEWCPPGHGEVYVALAASGALDALLAHGYEHLFLSNADNLGATLDPAILGYVAHENVPFLMEVAERTEADKKGGHVARHLDGRLLLRESAQCATADLAAFQDVRRHSLFNTNNIWINLRRLKAVLDEHSGVLKLPLIRNAKTLDPRDSASPPVYQLETAMGAAIGVFDGARVLRVGRDRFLPVKTCADLLGLRSDSYILGDDYRLRADPARASVPLVIDLDARFYKLIDDFEQRFPAGPPSLRHCATLTVRGDVLFERDVTLHGNVEIVNAAPEQQRIVAGSKLRDTRIEL